MTTLPAPPSRKIERRDSPRTPLKDRRGSSWGAQQVESLLRVSAAAAAEAQLGRVLETIAVEACLVTRAEASSILLVERGGAFSLAASSGLSENYNAFLQGRFIRHGLSASRAATSSLETVVIDDVARDPLANRP